MLTRDLIPIQTTEAVVLLASLLAQINLCLKIFFKFSSGQTNANKDGILCGQHTDIALNETGLEQATLVGEALKDFHFDEVQKNFFLNICIICTTATFQINIQKK